MVHVALSTPFDAGVKTSSSVFGVSDCIVYAVPFLRFWMLPSVFVDVSFLKPCVASFKDKKSRSFFPAQFSSPIPCGPLLLLSSEWVLEPSCALKSPSII